MSHFATGKIPSYDNPDYSPSPKSMGGGGEGFPVVITKDWVVAKYKLPP